MLTKEYRESTTPYYLEFASDPPAIKDYDPDQEIREYQEKVGKNA